jgi:hypothetical protein
MILLETTLLMQNIVRLEIQQKVGGDPITIMEKKKMLEEL